VGGSVGEIVVVPVGRGEPVVVPGVEGALVDSHAPKRAARPIIAVEMIRCRFISLFSRVAIATSPPQSAFNRSQTSLYRYKFLIQKMVLESMG
jgi:hypothetical protein